MKRFPAAFKLSFWPYLANKNISRRIQTLRWPYLTNENISRRIQTLRWRGAEAESEEAGDMPNDELHDPCIVEHRNEGTEEYDDGQHLQEKKSDTLRANRA